MITIRIGIAVGALVCGFLMTMSLEPSLFSSLLTSSHNQRIIRIGIAVGALVCGVIGATKPVFDIWGDTVRI